MLKFFRKGDKLLYRWTTDIYLNCIFKRYNPFDNESVYVDVVPGRAKGNDLTGTLSDLLVGISKLTVE